VTVHGDPPQQPDQTRRPSETPRPPETELPTRTARFAWVAVMVILIGVIALVVYALTDATPAQQIAHPPPTSAAILSEVASVPSSTFDAVGATTAPPLPTGSPTVLVGQPPLTAAGKPEVLFVGADFCPFCAAERWPLVVALSRFGRFRQLYDTQSTPASVFPSVQSFTFTGAIYTSRYVTVTGIELFSNGTDADGTFTRIATLDAGQQALVARYRSAGSSGTLPGAYPFVDIGNKMVASTAAFSPTLLVGRSQGAIAGDLAQAQSPAARAIVAAANVLSAGICIATDQQPTRVCASKGVLSAALALGKE
jgi:hypothetical protein